MEIPIALDIAADMKKLCPKAWLINYVNPTAVLGIALMRYAPKVKSFALCDGNHEPHNTLRWCKRARLLPDDAVSVPPEMSVAQLVLVPLTVNVLHDAPWAPVQ